MRKCTAHRGGEGPREAFRPEPGLRRPTPVSGVLVVGATYVPAAWHFPGFSRPAPGGGRFIRGLMRADVPRAGCCTRRLGLRLGRRHPSQGALPRSPGPLPHPGTLPALGRTAASGPSSRAPSPQSQLSSRRCGGCEPDGHWGLFPESAYSAGVTQVASKAAPVPGRTFFGPCSVQK